MSIAFTRSFQGNSSDVQGLLEHSSYIHKFWQSFGHRGMKLNLMVKTNLFYADIQYELLQEQFCYRVRLMCLLEMLTQQGLNV